MLQYEFGSNATKTALLPKHGMLQSSQLFPAFSKILLSYSSENKIKLSTLFIKPNLPELY